MANVVFVVAHPDDETLGAGGVIQRHLSVNDQVYIVFVTDGYFPNDISKKIRRRRACAVEAIRHLGVKSWIFMGKRGLKLDTYPRVTLCGELEGIMKELSPDVVYTHHHGDINIDHRCVFEMVMVACRPHKINLQCCIYSFEVPTSSEWAYPIPSSQFTPTKYVVLSPQQIETKICAFESYSEEVLPYPSPRSRQGILNMARFRGQSISRNFAEAFSVVREII